VGFIRIQEGRIRVGAVSNRHFKLLTSVPTDRLKRTHTSACNAPTIIPEHADLLNYILYCLVRAAANAATFLTNQHELRVLRGSDRREKSAVAIRLYPLDPVWIKLDHAYAKLLK
jgi:hypothetical protein